MRLTHLILLLSLGMILASCGSDDDPVAPSGPIVAQSVMGTYDITGTWETACYTTDPGGGVGTTDLIETRVVNNRTITGTTTIYTSGNGSCSTGGTVDPQFNLSLTGSNQTTFTTQGWSDGSALSGAPPAVDLSTLPSNPVVTLIDVSGTYGGNPVSGKFVVYIDDSDTATDVIWYRSTGNPTTPCENGDPGSEQCLVDTDEFHKL